MKLHLWRAKFDTRFTASGTDTGEYHVDVFGREEHVLSASASIESMESELRLGLRGASGQTDLLKLQEATYLGQIINEP